MLFEKRLLHVKRSQSSKDVQIKAKQIHNYEQEEANILASEGNH